MNSFEVKQVDNGRDSGVDIDTPDGPKLEPCQTSFDTTSKWKWSTCVKCKYDSEPISSVK